MQLNIDAVQHNKDAAHSNKDAMQFVFLFSYVAKCFAGNISDYHKRYAGLYTWVTPGQLRYEHLAT